NQGELFVGFELPGGSGRARRGRRANRDHASRRRFGWRRWYAHAGGSHRGDPATEVVALFGRRLAEEVRGNPVEIAPERFTIDETFLAENVEFLDPVEQEIGERNPGLAATVDRPGLDLLGDRFGHLSHEPPEGA